MNTAKLKLPVVRLAVFIFFTSPLLGQPPIEVWPPHWFSDCQESRLELLIYSPQAMCSPPALDENGPLLIKAQLATNPQYGYLLLDLKHFKANHFFIILEEKDTLSYRLKKRKAVAERGIGPEDNLYLITPDRFANGDPSNDTVAELHQSSVDRQAPFARHGGDIAGIAKALPYLQDLGVSSLWLSPLLENNTFKESYHGYAITNHYRIDPRLGSNQAYADLVDSLHAREMTMIMDVVFNHLGAQHHLFLNPPDSSFFHFHPRFLQTNYRAVTLMDPHASKSDRHRFNRGWFDDHMPDLNQENPHVKAFLIQNALWWILEYGLDAFRIDTYAYSDQAFMADLAQRIKTEVPDFFLFGEVWVHMPEIQSYFGRENPFNPHASRLDGLTDFQFKYAVQEVLHQDQGWTQGVAKLYYRLAADYLYQDPSSLVTFLDNHDEARLFGTLDGDTAKLKMALGLLYTMRGIPCLYYGTEILMRETANHGLIRQDFPGGWPEDTVNKFTAEGRSAEEQVVFNYLQKLMHWRRKHPALARGKFLHFVPEDGLYAYFRYSEDGQVLMVLLNGNSQANKKVQLDRFKEIWPSGGRYKDIISGATGAEDQIEVAAKSVRLLELMQ